jgi:transcriptional regulator with XRE-family HTH domain
MILYEDPKLRGIKSKLKKVRTIRGYTQDVLSDLSGVNIKSIASYEQNQEKLSAASVSTVLKLAEALGCEVEDIINIQDLKKENE